MVKFVLAVSILYFNKNNNNQKNQKHQNHTHKTKQPQKTNKKAKQKTTQQYNCLCKWSQYCSQFQIDPHQWASGSFLVNLLYYQCAEYVVKLLCMFILQREVARVARGVGRPGGAVRCPQPPHRGQPADARQVLAPLSVDDLQHRQRQIRQQAQWRQVQGVRRVVPPLQGPGAQ